jgi:ABC-2 type transport system permease protein
MVILTFKKEWALLWRDGRVKWAFTGLLLLAAVSCWLGYQRQFELAHIHEEATHQVRAQWERQGDKNPHSAAHFGTYAFKPVSPLWFFDQGVDRFLGTTLFLEAHAQNDLAFKPVEDDTVLGRFASLSPAFLLTFFLPLLIILVAHGALAAEREGGTWRMVRAYNRRFAAWFFGKWSAYAAVAGLLLLGVFAIAALFLLQQPEGASYLPALAALGLAYWLYAIVFLNFTCLFSALSRHSATALVGSIAFWIVACFVVPKAAGIVAEQRYPTPTYSEFREAIEKDLQEGVDGHDPFNAAVEKLEQQTLEEHGVEDVADLPFNWAGFIMQRGEEHETTIYQTHLDRLKQTHLQQNRLHRNLALLSPTGLLQQLSMDLAGSGMSDYYRFKDEAERYRIQLVGELNQDLTDNFKYGDWSGKRGADYFATNVDFRYELPDARERLQPQMGSALLLLAWGLALWLIALGAAKNSKV